MTISDLKKTVVNVLVLVLTCVVPFYFLKIVQSDYNSLEGIQLYVFLSSAAGSLFLLYFNMLNLNVAHKSKKPLWLCFEIIALVLALYSIVVLYLLFSFRNGISF